eukprot:TRINITY_DN306_c0_g1_i1.p1 TRINITY_DN306_c0_g1~~TRINITY_DN306_c0_g1_i1.p1  ORF type:complete len:239 (-),score=35.13 TRINITY_DN306_c0_g1_i1:56-772(-)
MRRSIIASIVVTVLFVVACQAYDNNSWDYLLYTLRWPGTVSRGNPVPANITDFTLHGMWPNRNDTTWPQYCTNQRFNLNAISDLVGILDEVWHDFEHPNDPSEFWSHEYEKHGTCAASVPSMANEHDFFSVAVKLHQSIFKLRPALASRGIVPSDNQQYSLKTFQSAIQNSIGAFPLMTCSTDYNGNVEVHRIQFCVNKSLQLFTCDSAITQQITNSGRCGNGNVKFPTIPRGGSYIA